MASRPPERDAQSDDEARTRFFVIGATRLVGVAIVLTGILGLADKIPLPRAVGYAFILFGLFDVFYLPLVLARKWRTPSE